ncbi:unnamed protein product [Rhodiola kirilowii]
MLGIVALSATLLPCIEGFLPKRWNEEEIVWRFPYFKSLEIEFTRSQVFAGIPGAFFVHGMLQRSTFWPTISWVLALVSRELKCSLLDHSKLVLFFWLDFLL